MADPILVDTNFFIQSHRSYYPFDVFPSFWISVRDLARNGKIISIDKVKDEIYPYEDKLTDWCKNNLSTDFFKDSSIAVNEYSNVVNYAHSRKDHYKQTAINEFCKDSNADTWLCSYALYKNLVLQTQETSEPQRRNKIKIPDVCREFSVNTMDLIETMRELDVKI